QASVAVRGNSPAAQHGIRRMMMRYCIFMAHENNHAAAFAGPESGRASIKHPHLLGSKGSQFGKSGKLKRIETEINAAGNGNINIATLQRRAGRSHGQQAGGAGRIHGVAAAFEVEVIADSSGNGVGEAAGQRFLARGWKWRLVQLLNLVD